MPQPLEGHTAGLAASLPLVESSHRLFQRLGASVYVQGLLGRDRGRFFMCESRVIYRSIGA